MKHMRMICLLLALALALLCAACAVGAPVGETAPEGMGTQEPPVAEEDAAQAEDQAPAEEAPAEEAPAEEAPAEEAPAEEAPAEETPAETPAPTEEPAPRPGKYTGGNGAVLTVKKDGKCTYETTVTAIVSGKGMTDTVTFHGAVDGAGTFSFTKVTYHGMDITKLAAQAGYEDPSQWEAEAAALYGE